ncbi:hypothetical protein H0H93_010003 [Arthromyces matolae]|nr:hypothetical protein H0H93_010003 [Arthromyces matolae]
MSGVTGFSSPIPPRQTQSESGGSNPPSIRSSPRLSPRSSPGLPSKPWKTPQSREGSLERISGPSLGSTPRSEPSPSWIDRLRGHGNQRPWTSSPRRHLVVPEEQTEGYDRIRKRVVHAVSPMLDLAGDVTHEVLVHGTELLKFAPIPGLEGAARVLLAIWDALQQIETNRLASLRLVERCADIFIAIQDEVAGLDKRVTDAVREPMRKLEVAFEEINDMMMNQIHQSSFRRYFKRDEALEDIAICNTKLQDCLGHFDRSIQLRILAYTSGIKESPSGRSDMSLHTKEEIHDHIRKIQERQNDLDRQRDLLDEQNYALALRSNKEVTEVLGVEKADIPAAIKTLLRALEPLRSNHVFDTISFSTSSQRSSTWPISHADSQDLRLRNREAIEQDIRALKAAYGGPVPTLPSWTITKFEIELGDIIGRGFFSTVYRGKWGAHVVAVKVLEVHTSQEAFVDEVNLWKMLKHPNVLELYGASSAEGSMPWFLLDYPERQREQRWGRLPTSTC